MAKKTKTTKSLKKVRSAFTGGAEYVSLKYITNKTRYSAAMVKYVISANPGEFRKSLLRTEWGGEVYMRNTRYAFLRDLVNTFRHINYIKY
jgi:hypothetical protein